MALFHSPCAGPVGVGMRWRRGFCMSACPRLGSRRARPRGRWARGAGRRASRFAGVALVLQRNARTTRELRARTHPRTTRRPVWREAWSRALSGSTTVLLRGALSPIFSLTCSSRRCGLFTRVIVISSPAAGRFGRRGPCRRRPPLVAPSPPLLFAAPPRPAASSTPRGCPSSRPPSPCTWRPVGGR